VEIWGDGKTASLFPCHTGVQARRKPLFSFCLRDYLRLVGAGGNVAKGGIAMQEINLTAVSTVALVRELACREGGNVCNVDPYECKRIQVEGAAIVLTVID
jgi:hypothetical protein